MKRAVLLLTLFIVSSCGLQKLMVGQLDTVIEMRISSQLDLYHQQKRTLEKDVDLFLAAQKKDLPQIRTFLATLNPKELTKFPAHWDAIGARYRAVAQDFSYILAKHMVTLDATQRAHFFKKLTEDNLELKEKLPKQDIDKLKERVEFFFGEVNAEQEKVLNNFLPEWQKRSELRLNRRLRLQETLTSILNSNELVPDKEKQIVEAFSSYQLEAAENQAPIVSMLQDLCRTLTQDQLDAFDERKADAIELLGTFEKTKY